jgi:two-component system, cell cycle sensor histidine kinase and response regulator CckA
MQDPPVPLEADRRPVVLVVDDEPMMRWFMTTALRDHFRVLVAADGQEALETVRDVGDEIAALVTDIRMPHLGGLELAAQLHAMDDPPPLLFISGFMGGGELPGPFLSKPFRPEALLAAVRLLIAARA